MVLFITFGLLAQLVSSMVEGTDGKVELVRVDGEFIAEEDSTIVGILQDLLASMAAAATQSMIVAEWR